MPFDYHTRHRGIIYECFCTVADRYFSGLAQKFVMRRFVRILESAPSANVIDEDCPVRLGEHTHHIAQQLSKALPMFLHQATLSRIHVTFGDFPCIVLKARGTPATCTLRRHFGCYRNLYNAVGFHLPDEDVFGNEKAKGSIRLRRELVDQLRDIFPASVKVTHLPNRSRSILQIDDTFLVSVLFCRMEKRSQKPRWIVLPNSAERGYITLLGKIDRSHKTIVGYHLFPNMDLRRESRSVYENDPWIKRATKLDHLSEFYDGVKRLWREREATGSAASPVNCQCSPLVQENVVPTHLRGDPRKSR